MKRESLYLLAKPEGTKRIMKWLLNLSINLMREINES
jgi:hypothetical protein